MLGAYFKSHLLSVRVHMKEKKWLFMFRCYLVTHFQKIVTMIS